MSAEPIVVSLPRDLRDLLPVFMAQRKSDLAILATALPARDFEAIRRVGHGMTGSGASYGFDALTALGECIVVAGHAGDVAALATLTAALDDYLARLVVKYV